MSSADQISWENWEDDHLDWLVITSHQLLVTSPEGQVREKTDVKVEQRARGTVFSGIGTDIEMALAMFNHQINEKFHKGG